MKAPELPFILESFRTLESNLLFSDNETSPPKSILFTSAGPEEGKSTIISNLAVTLSHGGKNVLLVDADLRRPVLHKIFKLTNEVGLSDFLSGNIGEKELVSIVNPNLSVLSGGSKLLNYSKLFNSEKIKELIKKLLERTTSLYDLVLFDSSPVLAVVDTALLASLVDRVVLVINTSQVTKNEAKRTKSILEKANARILGTILNNFNDKYQGTAYHPYSSIYLK